MQGFCFLVKRLSPPRTIDGERAFTYTYSVMGKEEHGKIQRFYRAHKRMPSYRELAELFGFKSKNAAYKLADRLVHEGVLQRDRSGVLIPGSVAGLGGNVQVRLVGSIEAGLPSDAVEQNLDTISLDRDIVHANNVTYALKVKGDSMIDAGIHDGDLVLVERVEDAKLGSIVVAEIDGDWTLKYLREKKGKRYLEAANPDYPDLHPEQSLSIGGVVRAVIRQY